MNITGIRSGWCKFRDLVPLFASSGFPLGAKGRLYSARARSAMLYGSETWPVNEEDVIRLERNDATMIRWLCNVRPEDRIYAEELETRLILKSMRECLQDRRLQWFVGPTRKNGKE